MRELKFRVWNNRYNEFVRPDYGLLGFCYPLDGSISVLTTNGEPMEDCIIEQYIGLKDKNGKEIYEGDIVRWSFKVDRNSEITYTADVVKWESYAEEEWPYLTISGFTLPESEDEYEVIGNIHENPELVKETE